MKRNTQSNLKITHVMLAKDFGGAERLFVDFVSTLASMEVDILAICQAGSKAEIFLRNNSSVKVEVLKVFSTRDPFAWRSIARKIKEHNSDIVQPHLARGTFLTGKACRQLKKPLVVTLHNYVNLKYYKNVTKFIPATRDQSKYLSSKGILDKNIELIPHFSHFDPVNEPSFNTNKTYVFGACGRLVYKKGFHVLLNAFKEITKLMEHNIVGNDIKLVIGGDGPEKRKLESLCDELGLREHVKFVGWVEDVESFLKQLDCFVLPSLDEPFGIAVLEAMAMGRPIISTKSQGPREILSDKSAYLVEVNDVESLFQAMNLVANNKVEREQKAKQALLDYKNFYAKEIIVPKFLNLYKQVIEDQKNIKSIVKE